jgi:hypothetical protein
MLTSMALLRRSQAGTVVDAWQADDVQHEFLAWAISKAKFAPGRIAASGLLAGVEELLGAAWSEVGRGRRPPRPASPSLALPCGAPGLFGVPGRRFRDEREGQPILSAGPTDR